MPFLDDKLLVDASVPADATLGHAVDVLFTHDAGAVAVVDGDGKVLGALSYDDVLRGIVPRYLEEVDHTAFLDAEGLPEPVVEALARPARECMRDAVTVAHDSSALHVAERFLHSDAAAVVAVKDGCYVGIVEQQRFCEALLDRARESG